MEIKCTVLESVYMSVHLFVRSCYSLLDSTVRIEELVHLAKAMGYHSLALTDHNVLYGLPAFEAACRKEGIKPIFGMETDVLIEDKTVPFLVLAETRTGYQNLIELSSLLNDGNHVHGISLQELSSRSLGLIIIAYGEGGWADSQLIHTEREEAYRKFAFLKQAIPDLIAAVSYQESSMWVERNNFLKQICRSLHIPTAAVHKIYYLQPKDDETYRIVTGIRRQTTLKDPNLTVLSGRYFLDPKTFASLYDEDDLAMTDEIADRCQADLTLPKTSLPAFPVPDGLRSDQYLTQLCLAGLKKRLNGKEDPAYTARLHQELDVIIRMHFSDYFLIVWDFIRYARSRGIYVGPGRGSACGSLVAYCLGITMIDPLKYGLLFERFLNPERVSMPDIDTDIPDNRRKDVIDYVYQKYGADHILNIVAFGTFGARQAIVDTARVNGLLPRDYETLMRAIPRSGKATLKEAVAATLHLQTLLQAEGKYRNLVQMAMRLEGLPRNLTIHPAGIVMSSEPVNRLLPTAAVNPGMRTSQYEAKYLEARGFIKMDFLGLRNLTMIDDVARMIQKRNPKFQILKIPLNDPHTYAVFQRADTLGIFQFESNGMKNLLKKMKPSSYNDIVAALALYRPASAGNIDQYLEARAHPERIHYLLPQLEPVLKDTYGVMIYQEQTMMTARICAGFSLGKADLLRKAISKKDPRTMAGLKEDFVLGCRKNRIKEETITELWDLIEKFGGYGFNKSHAVAYALLAYQTAWLKANAPLDFYCSLLDSVAGDTGKTAQYIDECRRRGISVKYPSVVFSGVHYSCEDGSIRIALSAIKGMGTHQAQQIVEEREKRPFSGYFDFVARMELARMPRSVLESLIDAGALDDFRETRTTMKSALEEAVNYADLVQVERNGQLTLDLNLISQPVLEPKEDQPEALVEAERNALGFTLGPHPIIEMRRRLKINRPSLIALQMSPGYGYGFGFVSSVRLHRTKRGQMMAYLTLNDETADFDLTVMPRLYSQYASSIAKGVYLLFEGTVKDDGSCIAERLEVVK